MLTFALIAVGLLAGVGVMLLLQRLGGTARVEATHIRTDLVAERVRAVGKLVGLEVHAKEIATSTRGVSWLPPILLSQAKVAMIFHFEKQYFVDLGRLGPESVEEVSPGAYRVTLPPVEGALRLTDVWPYDIQAGRVLGLIDVIQMNAETQRGLMEAAQEQATALFSKSESRYVDEARRSVTRHVEALGRLLGTRIEIIWRESAATPEGMEMSDRFQRRLALAGAN